MKKIGNNKINQTLSKNYPKPRTKIEMLLFPSIGKVSESNTDFEFGVRFFFSNLK